MSIEEKRKLQREASERWRQKHPDKVKDYSKRYYAEHKEETKLKIKEWNRANPEKIREKEKRRYQRDKEKLLKYRSEWAKKNPEKVKASSKRYRDNLRYEVFEHYGKLCSCCGEDNLKFLTIDHIDGDGSKHRNSCGKHVYADLRKQGFPKGFQTMCWNCNCAKGIYGTCPHESNDTLLVIKTIA